MVKKKWSEVQVGDVFSDGSQVTQLHEKHMVECYKVVYKKGFLGSDEESMMLSKDHMLLVDISKNHQKKKNFVLDCCNAMEIPLEVDIEVAREHGNPKHYTKNDLLEMEQKLKNGEHVDGVLLMERVVKSENGVVDDNHVWMQVEFMLTCLKKFGMKLKVNNQKVDGIYYQGEMEARCVSTDTGRYDAKGLTHHNSVTIRNIIFHALTHSHQFGIALVDLKLTEFKPYKGMEGVVGVANTVKEAAELLRVSRDVMYARNAKMAELGLVEMTDYVPKNKTDKVWVTGREFHKDQMIDIRDPETGEEKQVKASELSDMLK